ncbi:hypothetical protein HDV04_006135 [Boothiomyces sp. JEL0838]|nr:hypothetical protein HDV04_006116 [Boothiomyces sp. JEL0838]KAJ3314596.1 hypothetical protein HDV04_006135 [Boothiomyces sp. JEL0838]
MKTMNIPSLYRQALKLSRDWPKQLNRTKRFDLYIDSKIRQEFRTGNLENFEKEFSALKQIADGSVEKQFPSESLKNFLPPSHTYSLLDKEGQQAVSKKRSPFAILKAVLAGDEKLRSS